MDEVAKEQIKLFANALDRASTALLAIGVLTPLSAVFFRTPILGGSASIESIRFGIICYFVGAWALHLAALRALRGLNQ
jgi:hypothetical protein